MGSVGEAAGASDQAARASSFEAARLHFQRVEIAYWRVRNANENGEPGSTERAAFLDDMNAFRRLARQVAVETHGRLARGGTLAEP
jgi:hypothetical protein